MSSTEYVHACIYSMTSLRILQTLAVLNPVTPTDVIILVVDAGGAESGRSDRRRHHAGHGHGRPARLLLRVRRLSAAGEHAAVASQLFV